MYKAEYYDFSGNEGKRIKEDLKKWGGGSSSNDI